MPLFSQTNHKSATNNNFLSDHVVGSIVGTRLDLAEVFQLHAAGKTKVIYETRHLDDVNQCFKEIEEARVPARLVFDLQH
jgi:propanol-preferring alcohol dehydrogenase